MNIENQKELNNLKKRLNIHKERLRILEIQKAEWGALNVPPHILLEIKAEEDEIERLTREIGRLEQPKIPLTIPPAYKNWITTRCEKTDIDKLTGSTDNKLIALPLPEIFIPLFAAPPHKKGKGRAIEAEKEQDAIDLEKLAAEQDYLLIQGQAGSGKTTLLKHLAYTIVTGTNEAGFQGFLPVLIFLRDLPSIMTGQNYISSTGCAEGFLSDYFKQTSNGLTLDIIKAFCGKKQAVFLIDGLDEIEPDLRKVVIESLAALRKDYHYSKMVISSRPHGIDTTVSNQFGEKLVEINPLNLEQVRLFIEKWFRIDTDLAAKGKTPDSMFGEIKEHPNVEELIITPLMLTAACILYHYDKKLPEQRAELYEGVFANLVHKRFENDAEIVKDFLMELAFAVHTKNKGCSDANKTHFDQPLALEIMEKVFEKKANTTEIEYQREIKEQFEKIEQNCGLLKREEGGFCFWHLTFQEFLMARKIANGRNYDQAIETYWADDWYKEMVELFIGHVSNSAKGQANGIVEDKFKAPDEIPFRNWLQVGNCLLDIHPKTRDKKVIKLAQERLQSIFNLDATPKIKASAGEILGWIGDPRDLEEFIEIKGGRYRLEGLGDIEIPTFEIGKYLVTNQWYKKFMDNKGYENPGYWSPYGKEWLKQQQDKFPGYWHERQWKCPNAPVVGVCWYEADAFCRWLTKYRQDGYTYRLPTEQEWQASAAGEENRKYAWGNEFDENKCNVRETGIKKTSSVGIFLKGNTPDGVTDITGNVWEWTKNKYDTKEERDDFSPNERWEEGEVLRGGSWFNNQDFARCAYRFLNYPYNRDANFGFRCLRTL